MPTATMPRKPTTPATTSQLSLFDGKSVDMSASKKLAKECVGVRLNFVWFSTSRKVDKTAKAEMAEAVDTTDSGFSASKRLMDSKHPVIKEANELRRRVEGFWRSMSIPLAAFAASNGGKPEPGVRLINKEKLAEFDSQMNAFQPEVRAVEAKLNAAMADIKVMDQTRLKGLYRAEDYPSSVAIDFSWGFVSVEVPSALEKLAPQAYQREMAKLGQRMEDTYELATTAMLQELLDVTKSWVEALGPVTRIYPRAEHPLSKLHGAELRKKTTHAEDANVPEGKVVVLLRHKAADDKSATVETSITLNSVKEYSDLNPSQVGDEKRVFKNSTIEGMTSFLSHFRNIAGTVTAGPEFEALVQQVERHLGQCTSVSETADELRDSKFFRGQTHALMQQLNQNIQQQIETFTRGRRRIDRIKPTA